MFSLPALLSYPRSPISMSSYLSMPVLLLLFSPVLLSHSIVPTSLFHLPVSTLLSLFMPTLSSPPVSALLSHLMLILFSCFVLSLALSYFISSILKTFKETLSD